MTVSVADSVLDGLDTHTCPVDECETVVGERAVMCRAHWRGTPSELRQQVWAAVRDDDSMAWLEAMCRAVHYAEVAA